MKIFLSPLMLVFAFLSMLAMLFMPFWVNAGMIACVGVLMLFQYAWDKRIAGATASALVLCLFVPALAIAADGTTENTGDALGWVGNFFNSFPDWIVAITTVVTASTGITMLTPTKADDKVLNSILKVLNVFAGNVGKNKNKVE